MGAREEVVPTPELELAFTAEITLAAEVHIGRGTGERLSFTPITGGRVFGPMLTGRVVPGGGDWGIDREGTSQLEARYLLQASDGTFIDILNRGYYRETEETDAPYFRTAPVFQTDAPAHVWLTQHQFLGTGRVDGADIAMSFYIVR